MYLPDKLQDQSFVEWNHVVKGLVRVWEMARLMGQEAALEARLLCDSEARLAQMLGALGNDPARMEAAFQRCLGEAPPENRIAALCAIAVIRMELLSAIDFKLLQDDQTGGVLESIVDDINHACLSLATIVP